MIYDIATIKEKLLINHQSKFNDTTKFPNCNLSDVADVFLQFIEQQPRLVDILEALKIFHVDGASKEFSNARDKLASRVERFLKILFGITEQIEIEDTLASCFHHFFDKNKDCKIPAQERDWFFSNREAGYQSKSPNYFADKLPCGAELKLLYDLRNAASHDKKEIAYYDASSKNLSNARDFHSDIEDCITAYLFITYKYYEPLRDALEAVDFSAYFEQLKGDFEDWKQRFVVDDSGNDLDESLFYAKEVDWFVLLESKGVFKNREGNVKKLLNDMINKDKKYQMVLLGTAGMGKTSTLRYLTFDLAKKGLNDKNPVSPQLPVYLELKNFERNKSLFDHIVACFAAAKLKNAEKVVESYLERGRIRLFLDGWNELNRDFATEVTRQIKQLIQKYKQAFVLIALRQESYQNNFEGVPAFVLQDMSLKQVREFVHKNTSDKEIVIREEINQLQETALLFEFLQVPFYTKMFVHVRRRGNIPNTIADFIRVFIEKLLERERASKENFSDFQELTQALGYLAYVCATEQGNNNNAALTRPEILRIWQRPESGIEREKHLNYLELAVNLHLLVNNESLYSFAHHDYQSYFAGSGKRCYARKEPLDYQNHILFNVIRFEVGLDKAREQRICEEILPKNVHLAALCKVDCFDPEPKLTQAIIAQAEQEIQRGSTVTPVFALLILKELQKLGRTLELQPKHQAVLTRNSEANQYVYNVLLATARELSSAQQIFMECQKHFPLVIADPTVVQNYMIAYSTLINKSQDFNTAQAYFEEMKQLGLKPDQFSYSTLINKSENFATAQAYFEEMKQLGLKPNEISYSTLINKSENYATAQAYFEEMKQLGLKPDQFSYATLINKSENYATAQAYFEEMKQLGLKPDQFSYATLINKSENYATAQAYFEEMKQLGLKPDEISYSTLINRSENFATAKAYFEEMKQLGLKPNEISYSTLINRSENFATAKVYFEEMKQLGLKPDQFSYATLINKSENYATAQAYFEEMKQLGLKPNEISYNTLINRSDTYATAQAYFEEMKQLGLKPDEISYNTLINRSDTYATAQAYFEEMKQLGLKPDEISYNTLINRSDTYATAQAYFEEMKQLGLKPDEISYNTLINRSDTYATAQAYFEEMKQLGLKPDETSHNTLIKKSPNFTTAENFFREMLRGGLKVDVVTYNTLLYQARRAPFDKTLELLEAMQAAKLLPQSKFDKKQNRSRHYTLEAVQPSIRRNRQHFEDWVKTKGWQHPKWLEFYANV